MPHDVLAQLRDIHLPSPPSVWPLAIGYYIVFFVTVLVVIAAVIMMRRYMRSRRLKQQLLASVDHIEQSYSIEQNSSHVQAAISALLRQIVITCGAASAANAQDFLYRSPQAKKIFPARKQLKELIDLVQTDRFKKNPSVNVAHLLTLAREQIKRCRI